MPPVAAPREKNTRADGLRGVAALNVVLTHFVAAFLPALLHGNYPGIFPAATTGSAWLQWLGSPPVTLFYNGHFPVLVFFVLSGYVLTLPIRDGSEDGRRVLQQRLWGRYLRLNLPIAGAIAVSYACYRLGWYSHVAAAQVSGSGWLAALLPQGIRAADAATDALYGSILYGNGALIPPLWTLKIEFLGSLYLMLFYIARPARSLALPVLLVFVMLYLLHGPDAIYFHAIFCGSFIGRIERRHLLPLFAIGLYFGAFQYESGLYRLLPDPVAFGQTLFDAKSLYNTIGAILVTSAVINGWGGRFFDSRPIQALGRVSFSLYLIHFVVLCSLASFVYLHLAPGRLALLTNLILYLAASLVAAALFHKCVDKPAIRLSHRFAARLFA